MAPKKAKTKESGLSVSSILNDPITELAQENWVNEKKPYDDKLVTSVYEKFIVTVEHLVSIIYLINEKFKGSISDVFDVLTSNDKKFVSFFSRVIDLVDNRDLMLKSGFIIPYIRFLINYYKCLENPLIRKTGLRYLFLPIWDNLSESRLQEELSLYPQLKKLWENLQNQKIITSSTATATASTTTVGNESQAPEMTSSPIIDNKKKRGAKTKSGNQTKKQKLSTDEVKPTSSTVIVTPSDIKAPGKEYSFIPSLIHLFLDHLSDDEVASSLSKDLTKLFLQVFLEFLCDLLSQLPTRRFLRTLLHDMNIITKIKLSSIYQNESDDLLHKMTDMLDSYMNFPFQDHTGKALSTDDVLNYHYKRVHNLQQIVFKDYFENMKDMIFSSIGRLLHEEVLRKNFLPLSLSQMLDIALKLGRVSSKEISSWKTKQNNRMTIEDENNDVEEFDNEDLYEYVLRVLIDYLIPKPNQLEAINMLSLYPTEDMLWNDSVMPPSNIFTSEQVLALPKLNIQFLTLYDYLLRNFTLYRLETAYEIREDLVDTIKRMGPREGVKGSVTFKGWARMAIPLLSMTIDEVAKPKLSSPSPAYVNSSITIDISRFTGQLREEWEGLREHDVIFLVSINNPKSEDEISESFSFPINYGVQCIRGAEIFEYLDEDNVPLNDIARPDSRQRRIGSKRKLRVKLDPAQYYSDLKEGRNCYESFNLLIRRDPKESNFRSVLETIRDIMNTDMRGQSLPPWLNDVFLGYGNPTSANYKTVSKMDNYDYVDTFLDPQHLLDSFPLANEIIFYDKDGKSINVSPKVSIASSTLPLPPYKIRHQESSSSSSSSTSSSALCVTSYHVPTTGPYPDDVPLKNQIRFTPAQVEAIHSGLNPGLTMIIGPPGSGKTDTAVQIVANLYHNFPSQKIVLVTHSNAALNDLFMKIMERNVDPRHLLRLGSGERDLRDSLAESGTKVTGKGKGEEFDKQGRVNYCLERRLYLLNKVQQLSQSINVVGDYGSSCETAIYFFQDEIKKRILTFEEKFSTSSLKTSSAASDVNVGEIFPFPDYFSDVPNELFSGDLEKDIDAARGCIRHIEKIFEELEDYRAFELLRSHTHRSDYLLLKQARIVAMTCTHAAIIRKRLLDLDFKYDSLIMEEAAQVLDVETVIPMLLQHHDEINGCRLKRVVLIGDHLQLPPVIQNLTLQKYSLFDQSLFTRLVRLGVPTIILDKQGRSRPQISALYSWRYRRPNGITLGDLESAVVHNTIYQRANAGFLHTFQLINVPDFKGKGEFAPTPYYYQNLGEAEYVVAVYQYMRLMGYPKDKISIITTYNGQKHLIEDILRQRCNNNLLFGRPGVVSTVDKYQGQQNDYILLSLVRTESVGHIRDVRRLTVALSRSKLGMYVFCRKELFDNCFELSTAFNLLSSKGSVLQLVVGETYMTDRGEKDEVERDKLYEVSDVTTMGVLVYQLTQHAHQLRISSSGNDKSNSDDPAVIAKVGENESQIRDGKDSSNEVYEAKADPNEQV